MSILEDLAKLGPLSAEQVRELQRKRDRGEVLHVFTCEHAAMVSAPRLEEFGALYGLPLQRPEEHAPTVYLCCRSCCVDALLTLAGSIGPLN